MASMKNVNSKGRAKKGRFLRLPYAVLQSSSYASLSPYGVKLLVDIAAQYNGRNNGNLVACLSTLKRFGWRSSATLARCIQELITAGMLEQTRQGGFNMGASLYAVTWNGIDECLDKSGNPRHDVKPTAIPSGLWQQDKGLPNQSAKKK